ncbi:hypothetical protein OG884_26470 [Streptosporangium sp. NBC_01755]|uniref:hypothetical protein n=1 Tax=Streptosporangium sp. NBC_01755 TaxID=2975949 RepID=UPI002DD80407|nr:hypothetical protein [Streptosporangium sp. NBC_01755]WSC98394.1 hypothetical protein OG884_26470 [Streptosporangium sp. NBC_01755]
MASGLYVVTYQDVLDTSQLALDLDLETHKFALFNSTKSPNYNGDGAYSATNEISGTGYTAAGKEVTGTALSLPGAGVLKYNSDAVSWPASTLTGVRHIDMYADALSGDPLIMGIDLGTDYNTSDGTLLVTPHVNGLFTIDFTP